MFLLQFVFEIDLYLNGDCDKNVIKTYIYMLNALLKNSKI